MAPLKLAIAGLAVAGLLLVVPCAVLGQEATTEEPPPPQHHRGGGVIAVNLGGGVAEPDVTLPGAIHVSGDRQAGVGAGLRLGYSVARQLVVGVDGSGWFTSYTLFQSAVGEKIDADVSYSIAGAFVHWYVGGGFYARGVAGWGWAAVNPRTVASVRDSGFGWVAGLGYELRATQTIALGPMIEYGAINVDPQKTVDELGQEITADFKAAFLNISFGITWYL
jgi:hypothetical protein